MKIIVGCEESQAICLAFRKAGHEAYSCDLKPCSGGHPEWHLQMDIFEAVKLKNWDMLIAHPPCTFLAGSSVQWLSHPEDKNMPFEERRPHPLYPNRRKDMEDSVKFVKALFSLNIPRIVIENPVGLLSSKWMKPTQIVQPYMFGDEATKTTCLWLKNVPKLIPTNIVGKGERVVFKSGKSHPAWYAKAFVADKTERQTLRSKTFKGMAEAMVNQWGNL